LALYKTVGITSTTDVVLKESDLTLDFSRDPYLKTEDDMTTMVDWTTKVLELLCEKGGLKQVLPPPGTDVASYVREEKTGANHQCGSMRMGPDPKTAAIDTNLKV